jgi:hypothetical protein
MNFYMLSRELLLSINSVYSLQDAGVRGQAGMGTGTGFKPFWGY